MINVDVRGVLHGITAVLPIMQEQGCVHIINVASIGAHAVTPTAAVYCASKYAVRATPDGLRRETSVLRVTVVSPGVVESELGDSISDEIARTQMREFCCIALPPQHCPPFLGTAGGSRASRSRRFDYRCTPVAAADGQYARGSQ